MNNKLIFNPFIPGELNYRSGDLGRWLEDGNLEFVDRNDYQVKVRGFRVELGEIESYLLKHDHIMEAVVTAFENKKKTIDLCAYIVPFLGNEISIPRVRFHLSGELPDYFVPPYFVVMERIPLTPNDKIDLKALPPPYQEGQETDDVSPRNEVEARIARVWHKILNLKNVYIHSSFFELGGNSIKAINAATQLSKELDIKVEHIFKYETIADIAQNVTWKIDSLKMKILNFKKRLIQGTVGLVDNQTEVNQGKELEEDRQAYLRQVEKESFPSLTAEHDYHHILLTGGTGFLGAHLAAELLTGTRATLHLLVRGNSQETAEAHLKKKLLYYFGENFFENNKHRLKVVSGDLRKNRLGIESQIYDQLGETVEAVVHSAAKNNTYAVYSDLKMNNVNGTENVLEFAVNRRTKDFHFISAINVIGNVEGKNYLLFNEFSHDMGQELPEGRAKSKYEAEKKVRLYRKEGLNTSIYRLGDLIFNSQTGKFHENMDTDGFYARLKAFITLGIVPDINELFIDTSFVDQAAAAIVKLLTRKNLVNQTYHIMSTHGMFWKNMAVLIAKAGENIKTVKLDEFLDCLLDCLETDKYRDLILLHSHFFEKDDNSNPSTSISYAMERTIKLLETLGFEWEKPDESHIKKMLQHCKQVGFLHQ